MSSPDVLQKLNGSQPIACHLVGVAGSGMSGLAHILLQKGHRISGSDLKRTNVVDALICEGLAYCSGHAGGHLPSDANLLIYSSAVKPDNAERTEAARRGIPQVRRAEALAELCKGRKLVLVSGAHGKTTSSSLLAFVLSEAGRSPSYYIGAEVPDLKGSAHLGEGDVFVVEGDESDGSLEVFHPAMSLVMNIDAEHLDFFGVVEEIEGCFRRLGERTSGHVIYSEDDARSKTLFSQRNQRSSFGFSEKADYRVTKHHEGENKSTFTLRYPDGKDYEYELSLPGTHNIGNAAGVLAILDGLGLRDGGVRDALKKFTGARRRFDVIYSGRQFFVVSDYAHHPAEIRATLAAARARTRGRLVVAFQPHRYSRTQHLFDDFTTAFKQADALFVTDIYAASESPVEGVTAEALQQAMKTPAESFYCPTLKELHAAAGAYLQPDDLLVVMGAGDVEKVAYSIGDVLSWADELRGLVSSETVIKTFEPMARHTSMRVGGPADIWAEVTTEKDLSAVLKFAQQHELPRTMIGRGTNLLVKDAGIRGLCVHLAGEAFSQIRIEDGKIVAGAGARLRQIVSEAKKAGIGGLEFMEGIPATLGGALRMNAGAMGSWTFNNVESVRVMAPNGGIDELSVQEIEVQYRNVPVLQQGVALSAVLRGTTEPSAEIAQKLKAYSEKRWSSQPAAPSAGCIFKNPKELPAGKLIDELGLKDTTYGGARISPVHGNFIVNEGGATACDILHLIKVVQDTAMEKRGIRLEPEVMILGE